MKKFCTINTDNDYTCFSYNQIKQIVRLYNKTTEEKINLNLPMNEMYNALLSKIKLGLGHPFSDRYHNKS